MKLNLDYSVVKNNVLNNVLPYIDHIETKEVIMNALAIDIARDYNNIHIWNNSVLLGVGLIIVGSSLTGMLWTILGASAIGLGIINEIHCFKENKGFKALHAALLLHLSEVRELSFDELSEELNSITLEEMKDFLDKSVYTAF